MLETSRGTVRSEGEGWVLSARYIHHNDETYSTQVLQRQVRNFPALQPACVLYRWVSESGLSARECGLEISQPRTGKRRRRPSRSRAVCITERTWASTSWTSGFSPNWATMSMGCST